MENYFRPSRAEDVARFESRFCRVKAAMWVLFVFELFSMIFTLACSIHSGTLVNWVSFGVKLISIGLMIGALLENLVAARALFVYELFYNVLAVPYFTWITLCYNEVLGACKNLPYYISKEYRVGTGMAVGLVFYILITALIIWVFWIYSNYLKVKSTQTEVGFDDTFTHKHEKAIEMLEPLKH
ncbi:unnamed protein product, partial [Mesorhabditis belari]|uniref:MARVEL domain-containing protein n=1 Tax=Mesorhabditis belari TaxID=2138241 RepID=A0AAF3EEV5_9BILA